MVLQAEKLLAVRNRVGDRVFPWGRSVGKPAIFGLMDPETHKLPEVSESSADFPGTIWLQVTDRKKVLHKYWDALRVYLVCLLARFPDHRDEAEDLLQDFILKKILQPGWLEMANPSKGRFRDFLKSSLRHFVASELRKSEAEKRGGKTQAIPLNDLDQEIPGPEPNENSFDLAWLQLLLSETLHQMEKSCTVSDCSHVWKIFQVRLLRPALEGVEPLPYPDVIAQFGFKSPAQATNALASAKRMFARHLRAVVAQYESGDAAVRAELEGLRLFLTRAAPAESQKARLHTESQGPLPNPPHPTRPSPPAI